MSGLPPPYYQDECITLYCGDAREIAPHLPQCDAVITDPPYGETKCRWDVWPDGWPSLVADKARQLWCFGSTRLFLRYASEFRRWKFGQDLVWEKHNGSAMHVDRFRRVHELALQFYTGDWESLYKNTPKVGIDEKPRSLKRGRQPQHWGGIEKGRGYDYNGVRLMRSVIPVRSCHGYAINETQKPEGIIAPLLEYSVPPGGVVVDLFSGSGTTGVVARQQGKRAILVELREEQCAEAAFRFRTGIMLEATH